MPIQTDHTTVRIEVTDGASIPEPGESRFINAWSISLMGALGLLAFMSVRYPDVCWELLVVLPEGILVTFQVTVLSILCAVPIGCVVALARLSNNKPLKLLASTYVEVIRGIPLLVQLFFIFYSLSYYLNVPSFVAAIAGLSFCYGAYLSEVFRAGINAVQKGQTEAARSLGFSKWQTMRYIILPQAMRTILPPVGNECIAMLKDTSLISIVGLTDMFRVTRETVAVSYEYFKLYTVIALVYLIITLILSKCVSVMETRLSYYDKK